MPECMGLIWLHSIAAYSLGLAGSLVEACADATTIRPRMCGCASRGDAAASGADFFDSFRFDADGVASFRKGVRVWRREGRAKPRIDGDQHGRNA